MPELPDVETFRRYLDASALHQAIDHVEVDSPGLLDGTSPQGLGRALKGKRLSATCRHGKLLFIRLDPAGWLLLHFGMTGEPGYFRHRRDTPPHTRLLISFANGWHLAYAAPRKLGRIALPSSPQRWLAAHDIGPDALGMTQAAFAEQAARRRGGVKAWLMDQRRIAGIGNVYADEILFQAGIDPRRPVARLDAPAVQGLHRTLRRVLNAAIRARADPARMPAGFLLPQRRAGGRCPRCDSPLKRIRVAGRGTWYCPRCQRS